MKERWPHTHRLLGFRKTALAPSNSGSESIDLRTVKQRCETSISVDHYYRTLRRLGLEYGIPRFEGSKRFYYGEHEVLARIVMPEHLAELPSFLHPALLDACLHTYTALVRAASRLRSGGGPAAVVLLSAD